MQKPFPTARMYLQVSRKTGPEVEVGDEFESRRPPVLHDGHPAEEVDEEQDLEHKAFF